MIFLKEDGSLDIKRINNLPLEEHMKGVGSFTQEQFKEYISTIPIDEFHSCPRSVKVNYSMDEDGVDAEEVIKN
jgi:hypothetical protein